LPDLGRRLRIERLHCHARFTPWASWRTSRGSPGILCDSAPS
jgi:hypothetical protein